MLILGSSSPRRRAILSEYGIPFSVASPPFDERAFVHDGSPEELAIRLAEEKGAALAGECAGEPILTADTLVVMDGKVYSKPDDLAHAMTMLMELCGRTHHVLTGVSVRMNDEVHSAVEQTRVTLTPLTSEQIERYHAAIHPLDKAGAYAIQGRGGIIVREIVGNFDNVMGLPMHTVFNLLHPLGIDLWDYVFSTLP